MTSHRSTAFYFILLLALVFMLFSLVSCSGGIDTDEAKAFIGDFFEAVADGDYEKAETFLHPERSSDLDMFFSAVESSEGLDFQEGIVIEKYVGFSYTYYSTVIGGSAYELTMETKVGEREVGFVIEIVQNDNGYGIYHLDIEP